MRLAVSSLLGQHAGSTGRARRSELWLWVAALLIVNVALTLVGGLLGGGSDSLPPTGLVGLAHWRGCCPRSRWPDGRTSPARTHQPPYGRESSGSGGY